MIYIYDFLVSKWNVKGREKKQQVLCLDASFIVVSINNEWLFIWWTTCKQDQIDGWWLLLKETDGVFSWLS